MGSLQPEEDNLTPDPGEPDQERASSSKTSSEQSQPAGQNESGNKFPEEDIPSNGVLVRVYFPHPAMGVEGETPPAPEPTPVSESPKEGATAPPPPSLEETMATQDTPPRGSPSLEALADTRQAVPAPPMQKAPPPEQPVASASFPAPDRLQVIQPLETLPPPGDVPAEQFDQYREHHEERHGCRIPTAAGVALGLALVCVLASGSFLLWGYITNTLPSPIAELVTQVGEAGGLVNMTPRSSPTPSPTMTTTVGALIEPTAAPPLSETPAVRVTLLPPSPTDTPTPSVGSSIVQAGVRMIYVPGGTFAMGSRFAPEEGPIHDVTLSPYYIDQYEVTNAQWLACVSAGGCADPDVTTAYDGTPYYGVAAFDNYPVVNVTWYEADAYCQWRGARLPTEAEWEMAARWNPATGAVTIYPWGDDWDPLRLNFCDASCPLTANADSSADDGWPQVAPVGSFPDGASPVGALDMAGNVAEWVADWYSAGYYAASPAENPTGPASGTLRVVRGGAWGVGRDLLRSTARSRFSPDLFGAGLGLRCAVSADAVNP